MKIKNKHIGKIIIVVGYMMVLSLIIAGISSIFSYFNTGADRATMLHTETLKEIVYAPEVMWRELNNEGRRMDEQNLDMIERDYLSSWYVSHIALKTNNILGLSDYYTDSSRQHVIDQVSYNAENAIKVNETTLSHNLELHFFSEDGQLVSFTAHDVVLYKQYFENNKLIHSSYEKNTYDIIMLLEDGFWRVRHKVLKESEFFNTPTIENREVSFAQLKGINYYPKDHPWDMFGDQFDETEIEQDFKTLNDLGLNTIRIFIPYSSIGGHLVDDVQLAQIVSVFDLAEQQQLKVIPTLFDFYGNYEIIQWTLNERYIDKLVTALNDHPALLAWDIKNEPDLDYESRNKSLVDAWLVQMTSHLNTITEKTPITIGWSSSEAAINYKSYQDYVSFHYYLKPELLKETFEEIRESHPNKVIVLEEFGVSSYGGFWRPFSSSQNKQAKYHENMQKVISELNLSAVSWTMYDFGEVPINVVGRLPWRNRPQKKFGFYDAEGNPKKSLEYIISD